jgi:hypothetical protein
MVAVSFLGFEIVIAVSAIGFRSLRRGLIALRRYNLTVADGRQRSIPFHARAA